MTSAGQSDAAGGQVGEASRSGPLSRGVRTGEQVGLRGALGGVRL